LDASLASNQESDDAIDKAVLAKFQNKDMLRNYEILSYIPFNPESKRSQSRVRDTTTGTIFYVTKGAPQVVMSLAKDAEENVAELRHQMKVRLLCATILDFCFPRNWQEEVIEHWVLLEQKNEMVNHIPGN
jgi:magnesium-transporting ATPase (P-type)